MGASVKEDGGASRSGRKVLNHTLNIESLVGGVEVSVVTDLNSSSGEDSFVVSPGGLAHVKGSGAEFRHEFSNYTESTSARESLGRDDATGANVGVVPSEEGTAGSLVEVSESIDRGVLFIERVVSADLCFSLADDGEDVGFTVIITVSTDTKVALLGVLIGLEAFGETENSIWGSLSDMDKLVVKGSDALHLLFFLLKD